MLVELHAHSYYSKRGKVHFDGIHSPEQMIARAHQLGLNAITLADHDTMAGLPRAKRFAAKKGIMIIPGEEVSSANGHVLAIGIQETVPPGLTVWETVDRIREQGGIAIAAHPFDIKKEGVRYLARNCDAVEVFNPLNAERIGNDKARAFAEKHRMPMTAGSDAHTIDMLGYGMVRVQAHDTEDVLKAINKGRTTLVTEYAPLKVIMDYAVARLQLSYDQVMHYMDENYIWPKRIVGKKMLGLVNRSPGKIDYLFRVLAYASFGSVVMYSMSREVLGIR
ncbi:MAG: PHP domain-containing protein [Candidatus Aenigmarchaeota archaeon]|nr:PHP domain-containing protein [Candidatus Aenigmarchaeota archaeon]